MAHETKDLLEKRHLQQNLLTGGANTNPLSDPSQLLDPQQAVQSRIEADLLRRAPMPSGTIPQVAAGPVSGAAVPPATAIGGTGTLPGGTVPVTAPGTTTPQGGLALGGGVGNVIGQLAGDPRFQQVLLQLALRGQPYGGIAATEIAAKEQAAQLERRRVAAMEGQTAAEVEATKLKTRGTQLDFWEKEAKTSFRGGGNPRQDNPEMMAGLGLQAESYLTAWEAEVRREELANMLGLDEKLTTTAINRLVAQGSGARLPEKFLKHFTQRQIDDIYAAADEARLDVDLTREERRANITQTVQETTNMAKELEDMDFDLRQKEVLAGLKIESAAYDELVKVLAAGGPNAALPASIRNLILTKKLSQETVDQAKAAATKAHEMRDLDVQGKEVAIKKDLANTLLTDEQALLVKQRVNYYKDGGVQGQAWKVYKDVFGRVQRGDPAAIKYLEILHKLDGGKSTGSPMTAQDIRLLMSAASSFQWDLHQGGDDGVEGWLEGQNEATIAEELRRIIGWMQQGMLPRVNPGTGEVVNPDIFLGMHGTPMSAHGAPPADVPTPKQQLPQNGGPLEEDNRTLKETAEETADRLYKEMNEEQ
jgi:hypothetical protein